MNPIHHHCGPFNSIRDSTSRIDEICKQHDLAYGKIGKIKPYFYYNPADERFIRSMDKQSGFLPKFYSSFFKVKKKVAPMLQAYRSRKRRRYDQADSIYPKTRRLTFMDYVPLSSNRATYRAGFKPRIIPRRFYRRTGLYRTGSRGYARSYRKMPYYRKRKSYGRRKRRFYKRSRYNYNSIRRLMLSMEPPRSHIKETQHAIDLAVGRAYWWAPTSHLSVSDITTAWADTGEDNIVLVNNTLKQGYKGFLLRSSMTLEVWNNNLAPFFIKCYWLVAMDNILLPTGVTVQEYVIDILERGWDDRMLTSDEAKISPGPNQIATTIHSLNIYDARDIRRHFKIISGKSGVLQPGAMTRYQWHTRKMKAIDAQELTSDNIGTIKAWTVVPLFKVSMALGLDSTNVNSEYTNLSGVIHMREMTRHTWKVLSSKHSLLALTSDVTTAFTTGGQAPTEQVQQADIP